MSEGTVRNDQLEHAQDYAPEPEAPSVFATIEVAGAQDYAPEPEAADEEEDGDVEDEPEEEDADVDGIDDEDEEELPDCLCGEGWTMPERAHAYALYLGLPDEVQPTVAALLEQPGICVPDIMTMLEHIATMDAA